MRSFQTGLIGRGITQSRSPLLHEGEARALGMQLEYKLFDFAEMGLPDSQLGRLIGKLAAEGYDGCNVTYPFKQLVIEFCDELSEAAQALGAINTLVIRDGRVLGDNTDWLGFSWLLERDVGDLHGMTVAQIGAGGAGSATAFALAKQGATKVVLFDPAPDRAEELAMRLSGAIAGCQFSVAISAQAAIDMADGIVNATPIGMASIPGVPFDPALMRASQWLADIIYFPLETELLGAARRNGQKAVSGISMVVGQAAEAFCLMTGVRPDRDRMMDQLLREIAADDKAEKAA